MSFPLKAHLLPAAAFFTTIVISSGAVIYEGFEPYTPTDALPGENGGSGWTGAWSGNASVTTQAFQLDDPNAQIDGGNQSILIPGVNDNAMLSRTFGALTGTVYMSMLIRVESYNNEFVIFQLTDGVTGDNTQAMSVGIRNTTNNNLAHQSF
jgi:hypothetical protein